MRKISIMFSGQGAQAPGMGKDLYEASKAAKDIFDKANDILGYDLANLCFTGTAEDLTACATCQPAIFTMSQACLAALNEALEGKLNPVAVAGLSLGEYSGLVAANVLSFQDALKLVALRGKLMDQACHNTQGAMSAVLGAEIDVVQEACKQADVDIANLNCPGQIVISGAADKIARANEILGAKGLRVVALQVAGAYHSRLMQEAANQFTTELSKYDFKQPTRKFAQNFTGEFVESAQDIPGNLAKQICGSVRWESCLRNLMANSELLIECGPGSVLCGFVKRTDKNAKALPVNSFQAVQDAAKAILE